MLTTNSGAFAQKKDLHVGGFDSNVGGTLASVVNPLLDSSNDWLAAAENIASRVDEYARERPWAAIGVAALVGMAVGYLISQRS